MDQVAGTIINTHCECPAGRGPHGTCKHIAAVLLVISKYSLTGQLRIKNTCTEDLQTFNRPKRNYNGT